MLISGISTLDLEGGGRGGAVRGSRSARSCALIPSRSPAVRLTSISVARSFCPASKTQVYTGSDINYAAAANGARYADSENAFVYRKQIVPGCTCNGRDAFGLAPIDLAADPTIKQGDIVVTAEGPVSLRGNKWARAAVDLKPAVPLARAPAREQIEPGDQAPAND